MGIKPGTSRTDIDTPSGLGRAGSGIRLFAKPFAQFLKLFLQLRLTAGQNPNVDYKYRPDNTKGRKEIRINHITPYL